MSLCVLYNLRVSRVVRLLWLITSVVTMVVVVVSVDADQLSTNYYATCPKALTIIRNTVANVVTKDQRMAASLLRLHFHDCFVNACFSHSLSLASYLIRIYRPFLNTCIY